MGDNKEVDNEIDSYDENILCRNRDRNRNRLIERIQGYLLSLGLSQFSSGVALGYLQSRLQEKDGPEKFHHIITFILARLNGEKSLCKSKYEEKNNWQKGCPNVYPSLTTTPVWKEDIVNSIKNTEMSMRARHNLSGIQQNSDLEQGVPALSITP